MALGIAQEQAGDPAKAEQALKRAVALAPAYAYPHWYLGNLLLRNNRYDEAFAELQEQAGDPAKAEQALKRAVALAPAYAYPHWYLGNLLLRNNRYDEAFAELPM